MKNNNLVVTASNFQSFVGSLRSNLKLGYGICTRTSYRNNYFSAVLQMGTDRAYIARLNSVTGEERENVVDLCDFLGSCLVPFPQELMTRIEGILGKGEENKQKEAVTTSIKRVRKPRVQKEKK